MRCWRLPHSLNRPYDIVAMKKIFCCFLALLLCTVVSAYYRSAKIVEIFPPDQHAVLQVTSNLTSTIYILVSLLIYSAIFYTAFHINRVFHAAIDEKSYLSAIPHYLLYLLGVEIVKFANAILFLEHSLVHIIADESIAETLKTTFWYRYNSHIETGALLLFPVFCFAILRSQNQRYKASLINALAVGAGFLVVSIIGR